MPTPQVVGAVSTLINMFGGGAGGGGGSPSPRPAGKAFQPGSIQPVFVTNWPGGAIAGSAGGAGGGGGGGGGAGGILNLLGSFSSFAFQLQIAAQAAKIIGKALIDLPAAPIKAFADVINLIQAPLVGIVDALKGFVGAVGSLGSAVSEFVKLSNPIYVLKFNLAMEDLTASIGKILTPVLIASTAFVRAFADVIFKMSGPLEKLVAAFFDPLTELLPELVNMAAPFIEVFNEIVTVTAQVLAPVLKALAPLFVNLAIGFGAFLAAVSAPIIITALLALAAAFVGLVVIMLPVIAVLAAVGYALKKAFEYVAKLLGLDTKAADSSVGAAVRPATIGSVEDYGKKAQQAAFSLGTAADPATKSADYLEKIWEAVSQFFEKFPERLATYANDLAMAILKNLPGGEAARAGIDAGIDAGRRLEGAGDAVARRARMLAAGDVGDFFDSFVP